MLRKKKIAIIGLKGLPAYGGAATVGENIINQLKDKYDFTVYAISSHTDLKTGHYNGYKQIVLNNFPVRKLNIPFYYFFSAIHSLFCNYDLIHLHHSDWSIIIPILKLRHKVILTSHGSPARLGNRFFKYGRFITSFCIFSEKHFLKKANIVTCVSEVLTKFLEQTYNKDVEYIPNGIERVNSDKSKNTIPLISDSYILFSAGRIIPTKGCHVFFKALKKIGYSGKVIVVGDYNQIPDYYKELKKISETMDVVFTGMIKERKKLKNYIINSELFISPSSFEAMSMMLLEVASLNVPIICSDIPENKSIFNENEVLFFLTNNINDLSSKIDYALTNTRIMREKSKKAYIKLENTYLWKDIAINYDELYGKLIDRGWNAEKEC